METIKIIVNAIRSYRKELNIPDNEIVNVTIYLRKEK